MPRPATPWNSMLCNTMQIGTRGYVIAQFRIYARAVSLLSFVHAALVSMWCHLRTFICTCNCCIAVCVWLLQSMGLGAKQHTTDLMLTVVKHGTLYGFWLCNILDSSFLHPFTNRVFSPMREECVSSWVSDCLVHISSGSDGQLGWKFVFGQAAYGRAVSFLKSVPMSVREVCVTTKRDVNSRWRETLSNVERA
jgi:hypothetical protein